MYTGDTIVDALIDTVLELAAQVWINRDRTLAMEDLLSQGKVPTPENIDAYEPDTTRKEDLTRQRQEFVDDVMRHLRSVTRGE